jgi:tripeptidyl-peptidase-1
MSRVLKMLALLMVACDGVVVHRVEAPPHCAHPLRAAAAETLHTFVLGVAPRNMDQVVRLAEEAARPGGQGYGRFASREYVHALTRNEDAAGRVRSVFGSHVVHESADGAWMTVRMSVARLQRLFHTRCFDFQCKGRAESVLRCEPHTTPAALREHVDYVGALSSDWQPAPRTREPLRTRARGGWPDGPFLSVDAIRKVYNVSDQRLNQANASVFEIYYPIPSLNISSFETFNPPDLALFLKLSGIPDATVAHFAGNSPTILGCEGAGNWTCLEPNLDVQMLMGLATGVSLTYYSSPLAPPLYNPVLDFLQYLSQEQNPPLIHSISYGPGESSLAPALAAKMDQLLAGFCARGMTFLSSSGDDGVNSQVLFLVLLLVF